MRHIRGLAGVLLTVLVAAGTGGCAYSGAPSFVLFGAFFPAWLLLAGIGILAAIATRIALIATGVAGFVPLQLTVCVSAGLTVAVVVWLLWFGT